MAMNAAPASAKKKCRRRNSGKTSVSETGFSSIYSRAYQIISVEPTALSLLTPALLSPMTQLVRFDIIMCTDSAFHMTN